MIKKLHIRNFQSHKDSTFELEEGLNVLIGRSDSGKSAVWRSLFWLAFNSPGGEAYRSHWGGDTLVEVWLDNDTHIQRIRTDKKNMYVLNGKELKAIGREVPREVQEALNLTEANFQGQLDSSFLLMGSPGEVARIFNEYLDLESIDSAIQSINGKARKNLQELSRLQQEAEEAQAALTDPKFDKAEAFQKRILQLQKEEEALNEKEKLAERLVQLVSRGEKLKRSISTLKEVEGLLTKAKNLERKERKLDQQKTVFENLKKLIYRVRYLREKIQEGGKTLSVLEEEKAELLKDQCPICGSKL